MRGVAEADDAAASPLLGDGNLLTMATRSFRDSGDPQRERQFTRSPAIAIVRAHGASQAAENVGGKGGTRTLDPGIMRSVVGSR